MCSCVCVQVRRRELLALLERASKLPWVPDGIPPDIPPNTRIRYVDVNVDVDVDVCVYVYTYIYVYTYTCMYA